MIKANALSLAAEEQEDEKNATDHGPCHLTQSFKEK
jgi:hypothetical protein